MILFYLLASIVILLAWAFSFPQEIRVFLAETKRQLRLWVIQYTGEKAAQVMAQDFYFSAVGEGHDPKMVKKVLNENWEIISERLGTPIANDILGEPSPLERYG